MISPLQINEVVDSPSKLAILRVLTSRPGFKAPGREIAKLAGFSVPATHDSLKALHARNILTLEIIGKQHIYALNENDRLVAKVIRPMFAAEGGVKEEIRDYLVSELKKAGLNKAVVSLLLYGSVQKDTEGEGSDVDVAVVVARAAQVKKVTDVFVSEIAPRFKEYFAAQLDPYVKSRVEFRDRLKKNLPPVSTLMKAYFVLYGKEPLEV